MEMWKPIYGYTGFYEVSNTGKVRNKKTGKIKVQHSNRGQYCKSYLSIYMKVDLYRNGKRKSKYVHRLVCRAFKGPAPFSNADVNHKDNDTLNNHVWNLEWQKHVVNRKWHPEDCVCYECNENREFAEEWFDE